MKLLLNMNLSRELARLLTRHGHTCRHVADIGLAAATDQQILAEATRFGETILTHDLDYGQLLAFSGAASPSVIIFRLRRLVTADLDLRLQSLWSTISAPLEQGAVVIIEEGGVRVRALPIGGA